MRFERVHIEGFGPVVGFEAAFEPNEHALGPLERHDLGREDVRELARAATEGERAEAAHRARVTVGNRVGRAGQHHAKLRCHHM